MPYPHFMTHGTASGRPADMRHHHWYSRNEHLEEQGPGYLMKTLLVLFMLLAAAIMLLLFPRPASGHVGGTAVYSCTACGTLEHAG